MARNTHAGTGHFERHAGRWRVKHGNVSGHGRVTCAEARERIAKVTGETK
jgi:hypothetical protein